MRLFLDESGNSGTDIYDTNQPVLAYGGVWLDDANEEHFKVFLGGLRKRHRLQGGGEVKGKTLLKTDAGRAAVAELLQELDARKAPVSLLAVHKPFMAAGVLVEDCTDYVYNPAFSEDWTWDNRLAEPLSEKILKVAGEELLITAWRARSGDDKEAFKAAYDSLLFALSLSLDGRLAELANKMRRADLDELWACSESGRQERGGGYSPNLSAFGSLLHCCEAQAEHLGVGGVAMVHDDQSQYQSMFTKWFSACRSAAPFRFRYPSGNEIKLPLERLTSLTFSNSTSEIGIQLADVVASALRVVVHERMTGAGSRGEDFLDDIHALVAARDRMGASFPFVIGPEQWQFDVMDLLGMTELLRKGALG